MVSVFLTDVCAGVVYGDFVKRIARLPNLKTVQILHIPQARDDKWLYILSKALKGIELRSVRVLNVHFEKLSPNILNSFPALQTLMSPCTPLSTSSRWIESKTLKALTELDFRVELSFCRTLEFPFHQD